LLKHRRDGRASVTRAVGFVTARNHFSRSADREMDYVV
jgi:hypothetical protein